MVRRELYNGMAEEQMHKLGVTASMNAVDIQGCQVFVYQLIYELYHVDPGLNHVVIVNSVVVVDRVNKLGIKLRRWDGETFIDFNEAELNLVADHLVNVFWKMLAR